MYRICFLLEHKLLHRERVELLEKIKETYDCEMKLSAKDFSDHTSSDIHNIEMIIMRTMNIFRTIADSYFYTSQVKDFVRSIKERTIDFVEEADYIAVLLLYNDIFEAA